MFGDKRARKVESLIEEHFSVIAEVLEELEKMVKDYLDNTGNFEDESYDIHLKEHAADEIRRRIERTLFEGAFVPVYREDYMELAERVDKVANRAEAVGDFITLTHPDIPAFLHDSLLEIAQLSRKAFDSLKKALECLREDISTLRPVIEEVGKYESEVDKIIWKSTRKLFDSDLDLAHKLHLRQLITALGTITNVIEDTGDRLSVMAVKWRF